MSNEYMIYLDIDDVLDRDKWIFRYSLPCHERMKEKYQLIRNNGRFVDFLEGDFSRESVREYFLNEHNKFTYNLASKIGFSGFEHMLIPYGLDSNGLGEDIEARILKRFEKIWDIPDDIKNFEFSERNIEQMKKDGLLDEKIKFGDIIFKHGSYIVDVDRC